MRKESDLTLLYGQSVLIPRGSKGCALMEKRYHTITISINERDMVYQKVSEVLHGYADCIMLRTGYPIRERNFSIMFLIVEMTTDELGALSGKLGQIKHVKVSTTTIKFEEKK